MFQSLRIGALLLMGGSGERFGSSLPKQFHHLSGKPIYLHTLDVFLQSGFFDEIILSCHQHWVEEVRRSLPKGVRIVEGGETRQDSSHRGLAGFSGPPDYVVIHDAVRPFVSQEIIRQNIVKAIEVGAVDTCIPSTDTLVYAPEKDRIKTIPNRDEFLRGQTPQSFSYSLILKAHQTTKRKKSSDDCQLIQDLNHPIAIVRGEETNLKITSELDLYLSEQILRLRSINQKRSLRRSLSGLKYCVIGGTGGIGQSITQAIKEAGGEVFVLGRKTEPLSLDLRSIDSIRRTLASLPPLDGLINCAGILHVASLQDLSIEQIEELIDVNLKGLIFCCKLAPLKKGSHLINISSSSYTRGRREQGVYSASKAGVVNFSQALAEEWSDFHIHTVIPKRVNTSMRRKHFPAEDAELLLDPKAVAEEVLNLLFDQTLTGSLVEVRKKHSG